MLTHDPATLCSKCGVDLDNDERHVMGIVSRYVQSGKDPAPIEGEDMPGQLDPEDDKHKDLSAGSAFRERRVQVLIHSVFRRAAEVCIPIRVAWRERQ